MLQFAESILSALLSFLFILVPFSNWHSLHKETEFWTFTTFSIHFSHHPHLHQLPKIDFQQLLVFPKQLFPFSLLFALFHQFSVDNSPIELKAEVQRFV